MLKLISAAVLFLGSVQSQHVIEDRCTTIAVGSKAGRDGPMNTHTADCADCDFRINKVPAKDWPAGTMRPLYEYKGSYPGTVSKIRGDTWHPDNLEGTDAQITAWGESSTITGYIPEVEHTYALYEAGYGIINEHQVAIGESTCASRFWAAPTSAGGKAMVEVRELSHIALERTTTAREAIQLMGDLAMQYGYYSADWQGGDGSKGEGGEALTVIDTKEAWVFHITSDDSGTSAVWVAQRVPDDHVAAVANQFVIRQIKKGSPDFMYSDNVWEVAERNGLWSPESGELDFLKVYAPMRSHPTYATRRVWRVFNLVAPNFYINPETDGYGSDYPFSVKAEKVLSQRDLMNIQRDHYEGTAYDLTKGLQSGPYGEPNRYDMAAQPDDHINMTDIIKGGFERAISLFRTSYSIVNMARGNLPDQVGAVTWFTQHAPSASSYVPLYVASSNPPKGYMSGNLFKYDDTVAFWNFAAVGNWAAKFYRYAMVDVRKLQNSLETQWVNEAALNEQIAVGLLADKTTSSKSVTKQVSDLLTTFTTRAGDETVRSWREFFPTLITKYHDGYHATNLTSPSIVMNKLFYPKYWLDAVGYWGNTMITGDNVIMFQPGMPPASSNFSLMLTTALFSGLSCLFVGYIYGKKSAVARFQYQNIDSML